MSIDHRNMRPEAGSVLSTGLVSALKPSCASTVNTF